MRLIIFSICLILSLHAKDLLYEESFYINGFWLGLEDHDIFISSEEKYAFTYPNQVFYFPKTDFTSNNKSYILAKGSIVLKLKDKASDIIQEDSILYKQFNLNDIAQKGIRGGFCDVPCVFPAILTNNNHNDLIVNLYEKPQFNSSNILEIDSHKDMVFVIGKSGRFYQSIIIRHKALAFFGYVSEDSLSIDFMGTKGFNQNFIQNLGNNQDFDLQINLKFLQLQAITNLKNIHKITAIVHANNNDTKLEIKPTLYRYLSFDDINKFSEAEKKKINIFARRFGKRSLWISFHLTENQNIYISDFELADERLSLQERTLISNEQNLCLSNQMKAHEYLKVFFEPNKDSKFTTINKLNATLGYIVQLGKDEEYYHIRFYGDLENLDNKIDNRNVGNNNLTGFVNKDMLMNCEGYDTRNLPDYEVARYILNNMRNTTLKSLSDNVSAVFVNGMFVGFREEVQNLQAAMELINTRQLRSTTNALTFSQQNIAQDSILSFQYDNREEEYHVVALGGKTLIFDNYSIFIFDNKSLIKIGIFDFKEAMKITTSN
ncbi:hypothetical protein CQA53_00605 [Helicobacter didelphidarum]|uniref:Uncharacterized protein n=1 Tax=Helicobacter didelphidarum TaxID=2040648 RepID=A0A3D8ISI4_9HELI|nr:hypothetical protein [Helicobacter didelphidarum]RDU67551.1 hypothetical protein CQA53_00605 [Helicobacter didelphidarum]